MTINQNIRTQTFNSAKRHYCLPGTTEVLFRNNLDPIVPMYESCPCYYCGQTCKDTDKTVYIRGARWWQCSCMPTELQLVTRAVIEIETETLNNCFGY